MVHCGWEKKGWRSGDVLFCEKVPNMVGFHKSSDVEVQICQNTSLKWVGRIDKHKFRRSILTQYLNNNYRSACINPEILTCIYIYINFLIPRISILNVDCFVSPKTLWKKCPKGSPGRTDCDCLWARSPLHGLMTVACRHRWFFPMEQTLGRAVQPWKLVVGHGGLVDNFREAVGASLGIPGCREELKEKSPTEWMCKRSQQKWLGEGYRWRVALHGALIWRC